MTTDNQLEGKTLEILIKDRDINKSALARKVKTGRTTLEQWIDGKSKPSLEKFALLCNALDITPEQGLQLFSLWPVLVADAESGEA